MKFSLVGDSNLKRHLNSMSRSMRPSLSTAEVKLCGRFEVFAETLRGLRSDSTACVIASITNFLTSADGDSSSASVRVEPVLAEIKDILDSFCQEFADRYWFISPPMYRTTPVWYLDGLTRHHAQVLPGI